MNGFSISQSLLERELQVSPLASQTYSKSYRYFCRGVSPCYMERGDGCHIYDVDGNMFIDYMCALGPITIGYNDPTVNNAVIEQVHKFASGSLQSELEVHLAELICSIIPCAEMVRFVKNGSDATTAAVRLARAYTDRDVILMCGYHGMHDWSIGASINNKGVPRAICDLTKEFAYNDLDSLEKALRENEVAAVILEPIQGDGPKEGYLQGVKELAHKYGALLIFDEVVSGFHYALAGAQELYSVYPDLVAFGKGMANGYPISAVAGRRDILRQIETGVFVSTTFGGDSVAMAAALATLEILRRPGYYEHVERIGNIMREGIQKRIDKYDLNNVLAVTGLPVHAGISFSNYRSLTYLDLQSVYSQTMVKNGILVYAMYFLNLNHDKLHAEAYLNATDEAFSLIRSAVDRNCVMDILKGEKVDPVFKRNRT